MVRNVVHKLPLYFEKSCSYRMTVYSSAGLIVQAPVKPVFVAEAKATDPVLGGGSLTVRPEGLASASSAAADTHSSLPQNTQRARATGQTYMYVP